MSKSVSSPQIHTRWQHQIPCIPLSLPPTPSHLSKWKFQLRTWLWNFEVYFWKLVTTPLPPRPQPAEMEIWDFSSSGLSIKSLSPTPPPPSPHLWIWEFGILTFLDPPSKVGYPPPYKNRNISSGLDFEILKLTSESWSLTPPPYPHPEMKI